MEKTGTPIGSYAPDFELPGTDGAVHHLARYLKQFRAVGVVVMCNHCPYVRLYLERLKQIQAEFQAQGFTLIGINANDEQALPEDSFDAMQIFSSEHQLTFPYLYDAPQDVVRCFGAERTPDVFLIDQSGVVQYSGAIDNQPHDPQAATTHYFREAIAQLLANQPISICQTDAVGCSIKWRS
jgi:peroxiredoxin